MSELLRPCPFCGGEARTASDAKGFLHWVYCPECGGQSGYFTGNADGIKKLAIDAWNTRAERTSHKVRAWEDSPLGEGYGGYVLICSECGEWIANDGEDGPDDGPNYCFNCGAKMEKRRAVDEQV